MKYHKKSIFILVIVIIEIITSKAQSKSNEYTHTNSLNNNFNPVEPAPNTTHSFLNYAAYLNNNRDNNYHRPIYTLPLRSTPPEIAKYRNEGNFYQVQQPPKSVLQRKRDFETVLLKPPALFAQEILHVEPAPNIYADYRARRYTDVNSIPQSQPRKYNTIREDEARNKGAIADSEAHEGSSKISTHDHIEEQHGKDHSLLLPKKTRSFHDLYMRYAGPQQLSFGHVESRPELFQKRFESLNKGNRYKGEVIWADQTGGYGEHYWDMAQGKLR